MKIERTEDQILAIAPETIRFGSTDYEVKPLTIAKGRKWRALFGEKTQRIAEMFARTAAAGDQNVFMQVLSFAFTAFPEEMVELVFAFAPNLEQHRERILEEATDEQMAHAFGVVVQLGFPFLRQIETVVSIVKKTATGS